MPRLADCRGVCIQASVLGTGGTRVSNQWISADWSAPEPRRVSAAAQLSRQVASKGASKLRQRRSGARNAVDHPFVTSERHNMEIRVRQLTVLEDISVALVFLAPSTPNARNSSLLTRRWRRMDSNFSYADAVNLVVALPVVHVRGRG